MARVIQTANRVGISPTKSILTLYNPYRHTVGSVDDA